MIEDGRIFCQTEKNLTKTIQVAKLEKSLVALGFKESNLTMVILFFFIVMKLIQITSCKDWVKCQNKAQIERALFTNW